jgi:hypothetical protein
MMNWQEQAAGTNPTNGLSRFNLERITHSPEGATLEFVAISNRVYAAEFTEALGADAWQRLADFVARPTNRLITLSDPVAATNRFYRVRLP